MSSKIVYRGKDYSKAEVQKFIFTMPEEVEADDGEVKNSESESLLAEKFFCDYPSFPLKSLSPFNLGIYQTTDKGEKLLKATQYIGVVPLLKKDGQINRNTEGDTPVIRVSSRFGISATKMLETILKGDDFYHNPKMLTSRSYTATEWKALAGQYAENKDGEEKGPVFGLVSGIGEIDLPSSDEGKDTDQADLGMSETAEGIFEIIDFVNKAKSLCRKSLKKQSERKEENLPCKVKGRILVQKQIRENEMRGRKQMVYCAYNKMSANIKENQIIKYALHLCQMKREIADSLAEDIRFCMNVLRGVPLKRCSNSDFIGLKNNGAYKEYKDVLNAAKKVMSRYKVAYDNSSGDKKEEGKLTAVDNHRTQPHFIDMNRLFEFYCRALFQGAVKELNLKNKDYILELESASEARRSLLPEDGIGNVFMKYYIPDIVIRCRKINGEDRQEEKTKIACVIDAKYSPLEEQSSARRGRTHQILFYMKALDCNRGGLISPSKESKEKDKTEEKLNESIFQEITGQDNRYAFGYMLVDGNEPNNEIDNPQLCYLPLKYKDGEITTGNDYEEIIKSYLKEVLEKQRELDKLDEERDVKEKIIRMLVEDKDNKYLKKAGGKILDLIQKIRPADAEEQGENK